MAIFQLLQLFLFSHFQNVVASVEQGRHLPCASSQTIRPTNPIITAAATITPATPTSRLKRRRFSDRKRLFRSYWKDNKADNISSAVWYRCQGLVRQALRMIRFNVIRSRASTPLYKSSGRAG